jgi:flagellin
MGQVINTNMPSMAAQRALNTSQGDVQTALSRLSSGLRINSAKDDAAGLAISERFNSQIKGLNQAVRNANDAISLSQTAESALAGTTDLLQRARELAVQSANATNSTTDRSALQAEVTQLVAEVNRIADTTSFNGLKLLNGNFSNKQFQVGAMASETVGVTIANARADALGGASTVSFATFDAATVDNVDGSAHRIAETLTFAVTPSGGNTTSTAVSVVAGESSQALASRITSTVSGITADATTTTKLDRGVFAANIDTVELAINGVSLGNVQVGADDTAFGVNVAAAVATKSALSGLTVTTSAAGVFLEDNTGADTTIKINAQSDADGQVNVTAFEKDDTISDSNNLNTVQLDAANESTIVKGDITFTTGEPTTTTFAVQSTNTSTGSVLEDAANTDVNGTVTVSTDKISTISIDTVSNANTAIQVIDAAIATISSTRADLGATQNRFDSIVSGLQVASDNQSAARSRIVDADFAQETAKLTRGQILQQAGIAVLAQANAAPQNVLSLLQ